MSVKNSNDNIGNRTLDHSACSALPQSTAPPRAPMFFWSHSIFFITEYRVVRFECFCLILYEGWLISNAHSEISRKRDHVFKQTKVGSKVQYFSYKLTYFST